jgi:hypothetical protein
MLDLHDRLATEDRVAIAMVGMGGIGKTMLARRYAKEYQADYPGGIWWVSAQAIATEVLRRAAQTGLPEHDLKLEEDKEIVRHYLECWDVLLPGRKLLVLDDVDGYGSVKAFLPERGAFHVLMTTRIRMQVLLLDLGGLAIEDAIALLQQFMNDDQRFDRMAAIELCSWLGCLPLAIELVGRYLAETGTIAGVLEELKAKSLAARAIDEVPEEMDYARNVQVAIELSWQPLDERARLVLGMVSVFATAPIELGWVQDCLPEVDDVGDVLDRVLVKRSLLNRVGAGQYQMHSLVREFVGVRRDEALGRRFVRVMARLAAMIPQIAMVRTIPHIVTPENPGQITSAISHMAMVVNQGAPYLDNESRVCIERGLSWHYGQTALIILPMDINSIANEEIYGMDQILLSLSEGDLGFNPPLEGLGE